MTPEQRSDAVTERWCGERVSMIQMKKEITDAICEAVNAALEEAALLCDDREGMTKSQLVDLPDDIRALKEPTR